jgi:hypothetical protein
VPNPAKFPNGWPPVVQYINSKGLKAGLYTARSPTTCAGFAGSCLHELIDAQQYQEWGIEYLKDDSCGSCGQYVQDDYFRMQSSINLVYASLNRTPAMVLSIEGSPGAAVVSAGGHGNMLRVGHDIMPFWLSMVSLIDIGSGLWPYAHTDTGTGSFWNDLDMIEVGNEPDFVAEDGPTSLEMARAHFGMWAIMKAPLILGNNLYAMGNVTLSVLTNAEVIAVNQDALGVQAQRVGSWTPSNTTLVPPFDAAALITPCNASVPTQEWFYRPFPTNETQLQIAPCNASNPLQQWTGVTAGANAVMRSVGAAGQCVDAGLSSGYTGRLAPCNGGVNQNWFLDSANHIQLNNTPHCLDVYDFSGPSVYDGSCKTPGDQDSNQVFSFNSATGQIVSALPNSPCVEVSALLGGQIWTRDASGQEWCLDRWSTTEGGYVVNPCDPSMNTPTQLWTLAPLPAGANNYSISFSWNPASGGPLRANSDAIIDDDCVGHVTQGGNFCLDAQHAGNLEMWAGPLSGSRYAVALFNRTPNPAPITAPFNLIPGLSNGAQATFAVRDLWAAQNMGSFTGAYTASVPAHGVALLVLTP